MKEEAQRYPDWEPTLLGTRDSAQKLARKNPANSILLNSLSVRASLFWNRSRQMSELKKNVCSCRSVHRPSITLSAVRRRIQGAPLRVLFAGALTQRKGLADLFAPMKMIDSNAIELVVMGSLLQPLPWYRDRCANFVYEPPRPHHDFLQLMQSCDVFVFPSIVEGRAMVQQEAMACGLPLIATRNAGAEDLIQEGATGFLVLMRSPEALAEKISWCAANRSLISGMGIAARERAGQLTWNRYGETILGAIRELIGE